MQTEELGRRVRAAREARGLTQHAVADALGLPRTAVTQLEAGRRSVSTLELTRLSQLYVRSVTDFLQERAGDEDGDVLVALYRVAPGLERDPLPRTSRSPATSACAARGLRWSVCSAPNVGLARRATRRACHAPPEELWRKVNGPRNRNGVGLGSAARQSPMSPN